MEKRNKKKKEEKFENEPGGIPVEQQEKDYLFIKRIIEHESNNGSKNFGIKYRG
jgi:hypothetical protein